MGFCAESRGRTKRVKPNLNPQWIASIAGPAELGAVADNRDGTMDFRIRSRDQIDESVAGFVAQPKAGWPAVSWKMSEVRSSMRER